MSKIITAAGLLGGDFLVDAPCPLCGGKVLGFEDVTWESTTRIVCKACDIEFSAGSNNTPPDELIGKWNALPRKQQTQA